MNKIIAIAKAASELSKDTTKIGSVVVSKDKIIMGIGVNGYPPGYDDTDFNHKYDKVIHAEVNALINSRVARGEVESLYIYGLPPCKDCMKFIAAYGVKQIHFCSNRNIRNYQEWKRSYLEHAHLHPKLEFIEHEDD